MLFNLRVAIRSSTYVLKSVQRAFNVEPRKPGATLHHIILTLTEQESPLPNRKPCLSVVESDSKVAKKLKQMFMERRVWNDGVL